MKSYIQFAGGLTPEADKNNIWVESPNGVSKKVKSLRLVTPKVIDGSSIIIGKKKEEEPFDSTEYLKELTSIIANIARDNINFTHSQKLNMIIFLKFSL